MFTINLDAPTVLTVGILTGAIITHIGFYLGYNIGQMKRQDRIHRERGATILRQIDEDTERYRRILHVPRSDGCTIYSQPKEATRDESFFPR